MNLESGKLFVHAGVPRLKVQGIYAELPVEVRAMKYNRYLCRYTSSVPGTQLFVDVFIWMFTRVCVHVDVYMLMFKYRCLHVYVYMSMFKYQCLHVDVCVSMFTLFACRYIMSMFTCRCYMSKFMSIFTCRCFKYRCLHVYV